MKLSVNALRPEHQFRHRHPVNALNLSLRPVISQFRARRLPCFPERNRLGTHGPPIHHEFLLNNFPACYQRFASRSVGFSLRLATSFSALPNPRSSRSVGFSLRLTTSHSNYNHASFSALPNPRSSRSVGFSLRLPTSHSNYNQHHSRTSQPRLPRPRHASPPVSRLRLKNSSRRVTTSR